MSGTQQDILTGNSLASTTGLSTTGLSTTPWSTTALSTAGLSAGGGGVLPRVVFVGGLGRSGSTLLERLLGELPGVVAAGEVVHLWGRGVAGGELCGCGVPFGECVFWGEVGRAGFGGWGNVDAARVEALRAGVDRSRFIPLLAGGLLGAAARRGVAEYTGYFLRLYSAVAAVSGRGVVVDSSKHASLAFCLRRRPELDLRVVHVVRDSRAVAFSWTRRVARPETAGSYMARYSPAAAAGWWNTQNGALEVLARAGVPVLRVRYEDLAADPAAVIARVAGFAGISGAAPGSDALGFLGGPAGARWARLGTAHTVSGNPMRFDTGTVPVTADERWRTLMPARQRAAVTALTLPLLARYGYPRRPA